MRKVKVAITQMACSKNPKENITKATELVKKAAADGAKIILLQELFETPYFCQLEKYEYFKIAHDGESNPLFAHFQLLAKQLDVVLPISFFERDNNNFFNSIAIIDADGTNLGTYRKTHIPDGPCYEEKFYFSPGDTGFKVWKTKYGTIGVGICWDQWFPEAARIMALMGAEILLYPTAIGSEPISKAFTMPHWQRVMQGHAGANIMPLLASNRVGTEYETDSEMTFYGSSFIANQFGEIVACANQTEEAHLCYEFDLDEIAETRYLWGVFRDRRPEKYQQLCALTKIKNQ